MISTMFAHGLHQTTTYSKTYKCSWGASSMHVPYMHGSMWQPLDGQPSIDRVRYRDNVHRLAGGHHNAHTTGFECQLGPHDLQGNIGPTGSFA